LDVIDSINIHMLPFFAFDASTGIPFATSLYMPLMLTAAKNSWPLVQRDLDWFIDHGDGKKMYFDEVNHLASISHETWAERVYYRMVGRPGRQKVFKTTVSMLLRMLRMNE
jgi:hypothetical protein